MPREDFVSALTDHEIARRADTGVDALASRLAADVFEAARSGAEEGDAALHRLRVLAHLSHAVKRRAAEEAARAARAGLGYPRLGEAWYVSRQAARRKWPGLVFATPASARAGHDARDERGGPDERNEGAGRRDRNGVADAPREHDGSVARPGDVVRPYTVLLVEDDIADGFLIDEVLREQGMAARIDRVEDGVAALAWLRDDAHARPDLIVLDLNVPRMSGRELLVALRDDAALRSIPVVVLTNSDAPDDITLAYDLRACAYVNKPVRLDDFLLAVRGIDAFYRDEIDTGGA